MQRLRGWKGEGAELPRDRRGRRRLEIVADGAEAPNPEMGLVPDGIRMEEGPLNDPVSVWFRGYELSLRVDEANAVMVRPAGCAGCAR